MLSCIDAPVKIKSTKNLSQHPHREIVSITSKMSSYCFVSQLNLGLKYPQQTFTCSESTTPEKKRNMSKVNSKNTRTAFHIKTSQLICCANQLTDFYMRLSLSGVFIVNFEHISHLFLMLLILTLSKYFSAGQPQ